MTATPRLQIDWNAPRCLLDDHGRIVVTVKPELINSERLASAWNNHDRLNEAVEAHKQEATNYLGMLQEEIARGDRLQRMAEAGEELVAASKRMLETVGRMTMPLNSVHALHKAIAKFEEASRCDS